MTVLRLVIGASASQSVDLSLILLSSDTKDKYGLHSFLLDVHEKSDGMEKKPANSLVCLDKALHRIPPSLFGRQVVRSGSSPVEHSICRGGTV